MVVVDVMVDSGLVVAGASVAVTALSTFKKQQLMLLMCLSG